MKTLRLAALLALLTAHTATADTEPNYCHDPEAAKHWADLLAKHPGDLELGQLVGLRRVICEAVDAGQLDLDTGTRIFEAQRESLINKRRNQQQPRKA